MRRLLGSGAVFVALGACAPAAPEPQAARQSALRPAGPEPSSSEWFYVTGRNEGDTAAECRAVLVALRSETKCRAGLCQYAVRLAKDWISVCEKPMPDVAGEVRALEKRFTSAVRPTSLPCELEAENLISGGCPTAKGCRQRAERWATQCGADFSSPLVLRMLEVRVERATGRSVELDPRSCATMLTELVDGLACNNQQTCRERARGVSDYETRCTTPGEGVPLASGLIMMAVRTAGGLSTEPIAVFEEQADPSKLPLLPFADGRGAVLRLGYVSPATYEQYLDALDEPDGVEIHLARVFPGDDLPQLRLGTLEGLEAQTLGNRFATLRVRGEDGKSESAAVELLKAKLAQASTVPPGRQALALFMDALQAVGAPLAASEPLRAAMAASDRALSPTCRWLGEEKNRKLSQLRDRSTLIAALRRAERLPFADTSADGDVRLGASHKHAVHDPRPFMPACGSAYNDALRHISVQARAATLTRAEETAFAADVDAKLSRCSELTRKNAEAEGTLLRCAFKTEPCEDGEIEVRAKAHAASRSELQAASLAAHLAVEVLREDERRSRVQRLVNECPFSSGS